MAGSIVRCSLWLLPDPESGARFAAINESLASRCRGPRFAPHLTLLGGIAGAPDALRARATLLAGGLEPLPAGLGTIEWRDLYYRCLYLAVAPSPGLLEARRAAESTFPEAVAKVFEPHISLLYGDYGERTKRELAAGLGGGYPDSTCFEQLVLHTTSGPVEQWAELGRWRLRG